MTMTLEQCLFAYLSTHPQVSALVADRIRPDLLEQDEPYPAIAYSLLDERDMLTQQGPSQLREALYQFDIWAERAKDAWAVRTALLSALGGIRTNMGDQPGIVAIFDKAARTRDPETMAYCISMRFRIFFHDSGAVPP